MANSFTGKFGTMRIYDSGLTYQSGNTQVLFDNSAGTYTDISTATNTDDTTYTGAILDDTADFIYISRALRFNKVHAIMQAAAVGSGALIAQYYNGSTWVTLGATDGTASGGDCFAQTGEITWDIPADWAVGGNASVSSTLFLARFAVTGAPSTPPNFDVFRPRNGLYYPVTFIEVDVKGPLGIARPDEILVMNRLRLDSDAHYVQGSDEAVMEALEVSWTCRLRDELASGTLALMQALTCGNPEVATWNATGTSTKADTQRVSGLGTATTTPAFADTLHKSVAVQMLWTPNGSVTGKEGMAWNEVWFDEAEQEVSEDAEGVTLALKGQVYGSIEGIYDFGYRY